jgi:hypothetical protein
MGTNLMSGRRRHELVELATRTVADQLRAPGVREHLASLPPGAPERIRRPPGPPSEWPGLLPGQREAAEVTAPTGGAR